MEGRDAPGRWERSAGAAGSALPTQGAEHDEEEDEGRRKERVAIAIEWTTIHVRFRSARKCT